MVRCYNAVVNIILIIGSAFVSYFVILFSLSNYIDSCSDKLFYCKIETYLVAASILLGFVTVLVCTIIPIGHRYTVLENDLL